MFYIIKFCLLFLSIFIVGYSHIFAEAKFKDGSNPLVDGVYNSKQVVISSRAPIFSWEYDSDISSFTLKVNMNSSFDSAGELWNFNGSTTSANSINSITRISYNEDNKAGLLQPDKTYYWIVTIYDNGTQASQHGQFYTITSEAGLNNEKIDMAVDFNNPFNPTKGQITKLRFISRDRDRKVKLRIFSLSGDLVKDWPELTILKDALYTEIWDGKNDDGEIAARGIYFVNLMDVIDASGVTKKIGIIK